MLLAYRSSPGCSSQHPAGVRAAFAALPGRTSNARISGQVTDPSGTSMPSVTIVRLDLTMELGAAVESVTVTGEVPRLRTEDAQMGW